MGARSTPDGTPGRGSLLPAGSVIRIAKGTGVRPLVLHGTRHSFATIALAADVRPDVVSRALGHASTGFTLDVYVHPSGEEELAAADVIGAALGGEAAKDG